MTRFAAGDWTARTTRDHSGDPWDVLAFLVNATVDEVGSLVNELHRERERLESAQAQVVRAERLAALGEMASGITHELNQPLTAIQLSVDLVRPHVTGEEGTEFLELIAAAAERMAHIVAGVRTFGRNEPKSRRHLTAASPLDAALQLMAVSLAGADISVTRRVAPGLPAIFADPHGLQQVFVNLLANARDAIVGAGGDKGDRRASSW